MRPAMKMTLRPSWLSVNDSSPTMKKAKILLFNGASISPPNLVSPALFVKVNRSGKSINAVSGA